MITRESITGVILAGGLGRRISADGQGQDKGMVRLRGVPMIHHVIERLAPQVGHLLVNVNAGDGSDPARHTLHSYRHLGLPLIADQLPDRPGPLAGLHAAMTVADTNWVACVPCDAPFLPDDLMARLCQAAESAPGNDVAVASAAGRPQPVFLLARRQLLGSIAEYVASGGRSVQGWLRDRRSAQAEFADADAFTNLNTLDDLRKYDVA